MKTSLGDYHIGVVTIRESASRCYSMPVLVRRDRDGTRLFHEWTDEVRAKVEAAGGSVPSSAIQSLDSLLMLGGE